MQSFRIWIENNLRREQQEKVQQIYDMVVRQLLGSARDQTHLSLSEIEDDGSTGKTPVNKGSLVALKKLQKAQIFDKIKQLGDPELTARAANTENYLQKSANDQVVGPKDTVGQLLNKLFGDDAVNVYGNRSWESRPRTKTHQPDDNFQPGKNATSSPMGDEKPVNPQQTSGQMMPQINPMDANGLPGNPGMPVNPVENPFDMPVTPNGPTPPKPPGGLAMA